MPLPSQTTDSALIDAANSPPHAWVLWHPFLVIFHIRLHLNIDIVTDLQTENAASQGRELVQPVQNMLKPDKGPCP